MNTGLSESLIFSVNIGQIIPHTASVLELVGVPGSVSKEDLEKKAENSCKSWLLY